MPEAGSIGLALNQEMKEAHHEGLTLSRRRMKKVEPKEDMIFLETSSLAESTMRNPIPEHFK